MAVSEQREAFDCVVVGAGWYGLAAAKQFHCISPEASLVVLDAQSSLGGTWADERLYPGLKSNNLLGTYEYPDFPMDPATFGINPGQHIPGETVNIYLKTYASHFAIADKIRLQTKVLSAEHQDSAEGGWLLTTEDSEGNRASISATRLICATGLTSEAFLPHFEGQETFKGRIFHGKHFGANRDTLKTAKSVTVFGGTKFAWDAVYAYATAGIKVDWVIRSSGHGPCWMAPPYVTPLKKWIELLANTRSITWFSPCIWGDADGYTGTRSFLHGTMIGRGIVNGFWKTLSGDVVSLNQYDSHPNTAKLKPWLDPMFTGPSFSMLNYETCIFDLVKSDKVKIHIADVSRLSPGTIHLSDGTSLESDVLLAVTGWKHGPPIKFLPEGIEKDLGVPHVVSGVEDPTDLASQNSLIHCADKEILGRFPRLADQPVWNKNFVPLAKQKGITTADATGEQLTPYMLHRFMIPPSPRFLRRRDVAFAGVVSNLSNAMTAHLQGLYIAAYFSGPRGLAVDPAASADGDEAGTALASLRYETVLHNRFGRWRYPADWGSRFPAFNFDAVPYFDLLQRDLGLNPHRKRGWMAETYEPYGVADYRGVNDEWKARVASAVNP